MKVCSKCDVEKDVSEFSIRKASLDGLAAICKQCKREYDREYRQHPIAGPRIKKEKREWSKSPQCKEYHHEYYLENKEESASLTRQWRLDHPEEMRGYRKKWAEKDKIENPDRKLIYITEKRRTDPQVRIKDTLRARLRAALKEGFKSGSAVRDLGCSIEYFKGYLEAKFVEGMSWGNYGKGHGKWNIDHIFPISAYNLTDRQHVLLACNYLNLQPLWFEDNMSKGDSYPPDAGQPRSF